MGINLNYIDFIELAFNLFILLQLGIGLRQLEMSFNVIPAPNNPAHYSHYNYNQNYNNVQNTQFNQPANAPLPAFPNPSTQAQPANSPFLNLLNPNNAQTQPPSNKVLRRLSTIENPDEPPPQQQNFKDKNSFIDNLFQKQNQIIYNPNRLFICVLLFGLLFAVLGVITLFLNMSVKSIQVDYSYELKCQDSGLESKRCSRKFSIVQDMPAPVYFVYYVKNIYINHRSFLTSFDPDQLKGKAVSFESAEKICKRMILNKQIYANKSWGQSALKPQDIASPCGLKSQGFFNDTFALYKSGQKIDIDESKIYAGKKAVDTRRGPNSQTTQWTDPQDQHYKLYMLDGSLLTKKRLWGVINTDLKAGQYELIANNYYMIPDMKMTKGILLSTASVMGGKQYFYSIAFGICALLCLGFAIFVKIQFRGYGKLQ